MKSLNETNVPWSIKLHQDRVFPLDEAVKVAVGENQDSVLFLHLRVILVVLLLLFFLITVLISCLPFVFCSILIADRLKMSRHQSRTKQHADIILNTNCSPSGKIQILQSPAALLVFQPHAN